MNSLASDWLLLPWHRQMTVRDRLGYGAGMDDVDLMREIRRRADVHTLRLFVDAEIRAMQARRGAP